MFILHDIVKGVVKKISEGQNQEKNSSELKEELEYVKGKYETLKGYTEKAIKKLTDSDKNLKDAQTEIDELSKSLEEKSGHVEVLVEKNDNFSLKIISLEETVAVSNSLFCILFLVVLFTFI